MMEGEGHTIDMNGTGIRVLDARQDIEEFVLTLPLQGNNTQDLASPQFKRYIGEPGFSLPAH